MKNKIPDPMVIYHIYKNLENFFRKNKFPENSVKIGIKWVFVEN